MAGLVKFLLIKGISQNLWKNIHHTLELLLVAELTHRTPVIFWGTNCYFKDMICNNAFDLYFEPVSPYTIYDVINTEYTYYPPMWKHNNLMTDDPNKSTRSFRNAGDLIGSTADVIVSDISMPVKMLMPFIPKEHPTYGMTPYQIYHYLFDKYIKLLPDVDDAVKAFSRNYLQKREPILAVHMPGEFSLDIYPNIREHLNYALLNRLNNINMYLHPQKLKLRSDKFQVDDTIHQHQVVRFLKLSDREDPYKVYHPEIRSIVGKFNVEKIFLITDREDILEEFKKTYGSLLVANQYERVRKNDVTPTAQMENHLNMRSRGIESIIDAYSAANCDYFIGYGFSNLSHAVTQIRVWPETNMKLTYWMIKKIYNFTYDFVKTGRYAPEEADKKKRLLMKIARNSLEKVRRAFR